MKKQLFTSLTVLILISVCLAIVVVPSYSTGFVFAPELFADGMEYKVSINMWSISFIDAWGTWASVEHIIDNGYSQGVIFPIDTVIGDAQPTYFERFYVREDKFSGFIYFRGHERPLCGSNNFDNLPNLCLKIGFPEYR